MRYLKDGLLQSYTDPTARRTESGHLGHRRSGRSDGLKKMCLGIPMATPAARVLIFPCFSSSGGVRKTIHVLRSLRSVLLAESQLGRIGASQSVLAAKLAIWEFGLSEDDELFYERLRMVQMPLAELKSKTGYGWGVRAKHATSFIEDKSHKRHGGLWKERPAECGLEPTTSESANKQLILLRQRARYGSPPLPAPGGRFFARFWCLRGGEAGGYRLGPACRVGRCALVVDGGCRWSVGCR